MLQHVLFAAGVALAWFGLLSLSAAACFLAAAPVARRAKTLSGDTAMGLRLMPSAISIIAVLGIVLPAFAWLEPVRAVAPGERMGAVSAALALGGGALLLLAIGRGVRAMVRTRCAMRTVTVGAARLEETLSAIPVLITDSPVPVMVLDGVLRPRLYVSRSVRDAFTREEFDRAMAHELAHHAAHDNAKRHLLAFLPDVVGAGALARALVERWQTQAELAADAAAVGNDRAAALALASALLKVARLRAGQPPLDLDRAAFHDGRSVAARVHRLLVEQPSVPGPSRRTAATAVTAAALALTVGTFAPAILAAVHQVTELLVHLP